MAKLELDDTPRLSRLPTTSSWRASPRAAIAHVLTTTIMFALAQHTARRTLSRQQWTKVIVSAANYSSGSLSSTIRISSIPAPHTGEITVLSLNRPRARNAISTALLGELNTVVEQLHAQGDKSSTRALILTSESDDAFCAGADLKERLTFTEEEYTMSGQPLDTSY